MYISINKGNADFINMLCSVLFVRRDSHTKLPKTGQMGRPILIIHSAYRDTEIGFCKPKLISVL